MSVTIIGAGSAEPRLRRWCEHAMMALETDADLTVRVLDPADRPIDEDAAGGQNGIWLRPRLLRGDDVRLGYIVAEEVAHVHLGRLGVPHGESFESGLCQELFAGWFQYRMIFSSGYASPHILTTQPVKRISVGLELGYNLGKHVGAAVAGSSGSQTALQEWLEDPQIEPGLGHVVRGLLDILPADTPPPAMARLIVGFYQSMPR